MQLGGFTIKEKTQLENFDFSLEEITARYGDFLNTGAIGRENSEDEATDATEKPQTAGESEQAGNKDARPDNSASLDDWMTNLVGTEKSDSSTYKKDIHDNISKEFNDSNFWKESNYVDNPDLVDDLLKEL